MFLGQKRSAKLCCEAAAQSFGRRQRSPFPSSFQLLPAAVAQRQRRCASPEPRRWSQREATKQKLLEPESHTQISFCKHRTSLLTPRSLHLWECTLLEHSLTHTQNIALWGLPNFKRPSFTVGAFDGLFIGCFQCSQIPVRGGNCCN